MNDRGDAGYDVVQTFIIERRERTRATMTPDDVGVLGSSSRDDCFQFLQAVMDCAWENGLRPRGLDDHTNELKATRYHLEDLRSLIDLPQK